MENEAQSQHEDRARNRADKFRVREVGIEPGGDRARVDDFDQLAVRANNVVLAVARHHFAGDPADQP